MSKSILFWPDVYKEQGHWLPTLKWAQVLHDQTDDNQEHLYSVSYMGIPDCAPIISSYDNGNGCFPFHTILGKMYSEGYTTANHSNPDARWKTWHIWAILYSQYFKLAEGCSELTINTPDECIEFALPEGARVPSNDLIEDARSIWKAWNLANPNLVVSGYFTSLETLLLYWIHKFEKKVEENEEIVDEDEADVIPIEEDITGDEMPPEDADDNEVVKEERVPRTDLDFVISTTYLRHPQDDPAIRAKLNLSAFSKPELHKIINMATKGKISTDEPEMTLQQFVQPLETFHELIPCPREYDYDHYVHGELVHYVDPCITKEISKNSDSLDSNGYSIKWETEYNDRGQILETGIFDRYNQIIFVSAGSQVLDYEDKAKNLFHSMCKAMQSPQMQGYFLIIAVGPKLVNSLEWNDYDKSRILIADWVPQRSLLSRENLKCAIIHGGLATIKECVYFNRKFVISPMGKDQIDNALRLKHIGINNMLQMSNVNPSSLLDAINRVTSDYLIKARLDKLSATFHTLEDEDAKDAVNQSSDIVTGFKVLRDILNAQD